MESTQIQALYEPPLAAMPQLSEKPRQGFETKKTAWNPGPSVCNSTAAIGLRAGLALECVRETRQTGLYYMPARSYSPALGRFLQADPVGFNGGFNLYAYAGNDPVNLTDRMGETPDGSQMYTVSLSESIATPFMAVLGVKSMNVSVSRRDSAYLDKYYNAVAAKAKEYGVDPALVLGLGIESGFATKGTYLRTGDAFGMTGGSTKHMTHATSPEQNVDQLFSAFGDEMRGTGSNISLFLNNLEKEDANGNQITSQGMYNSVEIPPTAWKALITSGIKEMQRDIPLYLSQ